MKEFSVLADYDYFLFAFKKMPYIGLILQTKNKFSANMDRSITLIKSVVYPEILTVSFVECKASP
jgi:hypothetical protein